MRAVSKNTIREIIKSKSRFMSILLICAIGVGFFSGVRATCGIMKTSADDYYDVNNLFDLRVVSTFGLTENDAAAIAEIPDVNGVYTSKYTDLAMSVGNDQYLTRVYSKIPDEINTVTIIEGGAPQAEDECMVSYNIVYGGINIGDKVTLSDLTDAEEFPLSRREYTVTGIYKTPMFIAMTQRGTTNIGDGAIDAFMIVPEEHFTQEPFTEIYIKSDRLNGMPCYSDKYKNLRDEISDKLESLGKDRSAIRYDEVIGEATRDIEQGEKDLEKAKTDGQKELDDAKSELDDAVKKIADGEKELKDSGNKIDDGRAQIADAERELENAKKELDDGKAELAANTPDFESAKAELDNALSVIEEGEKQLAEGQGVLDESKTKLDAAQAQIDLQKTELESAKVQLAGLIQMMGENSPEVVALKARISEGEQQLTAAQTQIDEGFKQYELSAAEIAEKSEELKQGRTEYEKGLADYNAGLEKYNEAVKKIEDGEREYNNGVKTLAEKRKELEDGEKQYEEGLAELADARKKYEDGLVEYNDGVTTFNTEIADAEKELADAREKIANAGNAEWYIFTRDDNAGYAEYEANADRIGKIAVVFPVFFLLVAGLVCLTTMSRMVEEQRTQIGTLKALGYSSGAIMKHYMIYAVSGAAVGGAIGAIGGCFLFPGVIVYAYSMMYDIKKIHFLFTPDNMIISIGSMIAAIALTVFFSCRKALRETPASLMRPKAPKAGKRVFLERVAFLWNHLNFFGRVSVRNLFRYKRRMFMTIVGIAGCTALSLTGFGLKNSINDVVELQYNEINRYSGYAAYDEDAKPSEVQSIYDALLDYNKDTDYTRARIKQYTLENSGESAQVYVTAVENSETFERLIDLRERKSGEKVSLSSGAVITEKAAKLLNVKIGDEISVKISDGETKTVRIGGITEHYISHYLYLPESVYTEVFGEAPKYNMVYFDNGISRDKDVQDEFTAKMLANDNVLVVIMNASSITSISETLSIMDLVTVVLIVSAAALAFVVLYNLTNVNITERIREIATLKVLGFYDAEVSSYVFRENITLSLMGGVVGLGLGYALCMFVVNTAELDEMMFGRSIHVPSYLWAFLVTAAFSMIVNIIMTGALKKISMVESLKSVE